ncbi:MAG: hypothetical protein H7144_17860 [Burkholderiales bacterium]|nr:hypothetical protein [Phycisphaerae bacterium]
MSRLDQLKTLLERTPTDPFLTYGIALEHKKLNETTEAIQWLDRTIGLDVNYCYAYYQKGQILETTGDTDAARSAYLAGIKSAQAAGDAHAQGELQGALDMLP